MVHESAAAAKLAAIMTLRSDQEAAAQRPDVVIVGGGVIGLTTALMLADAGKRVVILERTRIGTEASWAGAGMLPPGNLSTAVTPEQRLRGLSHQLWPNLTERLRSETQIDNGYVHCGALELPECREDQTAGLERIRMEWREQEIEAEIIRHASDSDSSDSDRQEVPAYGFESAVFLPDFCQVRNPRHLKALGAACLGQGVVIRESVSSVQLREVSSGAWSVESSCGHFSDCQILAAAGAWTADVLQPTGTELPIVPVRGQMVQFRTAPGLLKRVIEQGRRYLVPRPDGLVLAGSTEEEAGFEKKNTSAAVAELIRFATRLVPALEDAEIERTWAGLRPGSPDELPYLGRVPGTENVFAAAGHFRSGLQMSPGTAAVLAALMTGQTPPIPINGLEPGRLPGIATTPQGRNLT